MAHLSDYVLWKGDLDFREREFRIEDNLVLSELVYIDYKPFFEYKKTDKVTLRYAIYNL
jgi:hypothetical protein